MHSIARCYGTMTSYNIGKVYLNFVADALLVGIFLDIQRADDERQFVERN